MHTSIDQYLTALQAKGRAAGTLRMVTQDLRQFVTWWENQRGRTFDPGTVRFEDLRDWCNSRQQERKAASTSNRSLTVLRGYFNWSIANKLIRVNPAKNLKDIPTEPLSPRSLPPDAVDALLREALLESEAVIRLRGKEFFSGKPTLI